MNSKTWTRIIALTLFAALAMPVSLAAQDKAKPKHQYHRYQLIDVGTFGGPQSFQYLGNVGANRVLNNRGTFAGWADTSMIDPLCFFDNPDCNVAHAFVWQNGAKTDLGILPGGLNSQVNWISAAGVTAGAADTGQMDPLAGIPQIDAVLWKNGGIIDLGNLPEGGYQSFTGAVNSRGEVVGNANNTIPDPNSMFTGYPTQTRAFYWENGVMQDLGTLGTGTDAEATQINERGQVVGVSYVNSIPSAFCSGVGFPVTTGSFIWDKKHGMQDLGGLGGTCTVAYDLNNRGHVVGQSNRSDDQSQHPFVWETATGITELPTAANVYGAALAVNDAGDIVGLGDAPNSQASATLWRKTGRKYQTTYLGRLHSGDCAIGVSINASGQVIGDSGPNGCSTTLPFLWKDGGPMVDLNTLIPPNSGLQLFEAGQINDRGEITVSASDSNGDNHAVLLIPCDENHPDVEGCDYSMVDAATLQQSATTSTEHPATGTPHGRMPAGMLNRFRYRLGQRIPGSVIDSTPAAEQASPVNTDGVDVEGRQLLGPLYGHYKGYCGVYGGKLTGYCTAYSYYSCAAKVSTACPSGKTATKPGYFQCSDRFSRYVDLARGCGFN
jgi:probable HAF family extracellular repeat protein